MTIRKYRVRQGFTYGAFSQYGAGDIVELEEDVAVHSLDKLELAEIVQNVPPEAPTEPAPPPEAPLLEDIETEEVEPAPKPRPKKKSGA